MTAAQKIAKEKFKKAIAYRQKTGVSLKEAFAHIYGKKTVKKKAAKKVIRKKAAKKIGKIDPNKAFKKQMQVNKIINTKYKNWEYPVPPVYTGNWTATAWSDWIKKNGRKIGAVKHKVVRKKVAKKKKISETGILNRIHKVKHDVERLDEAQHKHMMGNIKAKPTIIALAKKISNFTDSNDHNKSILLLAKFLKSKKAIQIMNNVIKMADNFGYMPKNLIDIREQIYNSLMMILKSKYGNVDYKTIQNSF